jgi:hypothetical protein
MKFVEKNRFFYNHEILMEYATQFIIWVKYPQVKCDILVGFLVKEH